MLKTHYTYQPENHESMKHETVFYGRGRNLNTDGILSAITAIWRDLAASDRQEPRLIS